MHNLIRLFRAAGVRFSRDGCAFLAQALAYNAIFAMIPLALLAVAVFGFIYGTQEGQARLLATVGDIAPNVRAFLAENLQNAVAFRGISGTIAIVGLIWSGKNLFQGLAFALNRALGIQTGRPFLHDILLAIVMLPAMGVVLLVTTAVPPAVTFVTHLTGFGFPALTQLLAVVLSIVVIFFVAATLYTFLPNRHVPWTFGIPGALFTAFAYEISQIAFSLYTARVNVFHVYGALSTVFALLLWLYLNAVIFLFGAELSAVCFDRQEQPAQSAPTLATPGEAAKAEAAN